jgi:hypothetical protein
LANLNVIKIFFHSIAPISIVAAGNTKGGSITVLLTSCLTFLDWTVLKIKTKIVCCYTADSKPVKQEVNGTEILSLKYSLVAASLELNENGLQQNWLHNSAYVIET